MVPSYLVVLGALTTACGSKDEVIPFVATGGKECGRPLQRVEWAEAERRSRNRNRKAKATSASPKPVIDASYKVDGKNVTITYQTSNFKLFEEDMNKKANVQGEGHLAPVCGWQAESDDQQVSSLTLTNLTTGLPSN